MAVFALVLAVALQAQARPPAASACGAQRAQLLPIDQAATQPEFFAFRARLQAAIARRDEAALLAAVDPGIRLSFGADNGINVLRTQLRDPKTTLWADLATALALGGTFAAPTSFTAPYVFASWPSNADSFECAAVIGESVRVRRTAEADSAVVGRVSFEIVQVLPDSRSATVVHVRLASGVTGFVSAAFVRSPIDRRATFERVNGQWRLRSFVAGD
jgi:hypothetical protein